MKNYPLIETPEQTLEMITLDGILFHMRIFLKDEILGITFNCSWDTENGLGIRLLNEKIIEVGYQDVAI